MLQVTFLPLLRLTDFGNGSKESFSRQAMRCSLKPCMAGVKAGCVHLCRVAGNTV